MKDEKPPSFICGVKMSPKALQLLFLMFNWNCALCILQLWLRRTRRMLHCTCPTRHCCPQSATWCSMRPRPTASLRSCLRKQASFKTPGTRYGCSGGPLTSTIACFWFFYFFLFFYGNPNLRFSPSFQATQKGDLVAGLKKQLEEREKQLAAQQEDAAAARNRQKELTKVCFPEAVKKRKKRKLIER